MNNVTLRGETDHAEPDTAERGEAGGLPGGVAAGVRFCDRGERNRHRRAVM